MGVVDHICALPSSVGWTAVHCGYGLGRAAHCLQWQPERAPLRLWTGWCGSLSAVAAREEEKHEITAGVYDCTVRLDCDTLLPVLLVSVEEEKHESDSLLPVLLGFAEERGTRVLPPF